MTHLSYASHKVSKPRNKIKLLKGDMMIEMMRAGVNVGFMLTIPKKSVKVHYDRFLAKRAERLNKYEAA